MYTDQFMAANAVFESGGDFIGNSPVSSKEECALLCLSIADCVAATTMEDGGGLLCDMFSSTVISSEANMVLKKVGEGKSSEGIGCIFHLRDQWVPITIT